MATYENLITTREVGLAIENVLVAPENTSWTPGRINIPDSIPSGFIHLGAVVEETPQLQITREKYQLPTGIPRVLQYQAVRGLTGQFQISLWSHANRVAKYGLGNYSAVRTIVNSFGNAVAVTAIHATNNHMVINVGTTAQASFVVGDIIAAGTTSADLLTGDKEAEVAELNYGTPGWIRLTTPGFLVDITTNDKVAKVSYSRIPFGTKIMPFYVVLGVADFIDGVQVIHHLGKAAPSGEWTEQIRPEAAIQVATSWDLFGYTTTVYGTAGVTRELIVGERFWFPKQ